MIDLIVVALVAVIVLSRFTKFKLPRDPRGGRATRADLEKLKQNPLLRDDAPKMGPKVVDITAQAEARKAGGEGEAKKPVSKTKAEKEARARADKLEGVAKIMEMDAHFDEAVFLDGAKSAYRYFYDCWNARDEEAMDNLCAPSLMERVAGEMADKSYQPVEVVELRGAKIVNTRLHGKTAMIDVQFDTLEREGNADPRPVSRRWMLARALGSEDPNWELQSINRGVDA